MTIMTNLPLLFFVININTDLLGPFIMKMEEDCRNLLGTISHGLCKHARLRNSNSRKKSIILDSIELIAIKNKISSTLEMNINIFVQLAFSNKMIVKNKLRIKLKYIYSSL